MTISSETLGLEARLLTVALLFCQLWFIVRTVTVARSMASYGRTPMLLGKAEFNATGAICATVSAVTIVLIIRYVPDFGAQPVSPWLLALHVPAAAVFFASLVTLRYSPTLKRRENARLHKRLGYLSLGCFAIAFPTGAAMLLQM